MMFTIQTAIVTMATMETLCKDRLVHLGPRDFGRDAPQKGELDGLVYVSQLTSACKSLNH